MYSSYNIDIGIHRHIHRYRHRHIPDIDIDIDTYIDPQKCGADGLQGNSRPQKSTRCPTSCYCAEEVILRRDSYKQIHSFAPKDCETQTNGISQVSLSRAFEGVGSSGVPLTGAFGNRSFRLLRVCVTVTGPILTKVGTCARSDVTWRSAYSNVRTLE